MGTKLRCRGSKIWVDFKYERAPIFCYYCGQIGHNEKLYLKRKQDVERNCVLKDQFGIWLRVGGRRTEGWGTRGSRTEKLAQGPLTLGVSPEGSRFCKDQETRGEVSEDFENARKDHESEGGRKGERSILGKKEGSGVIVEGADRVESPNNEYSELELPVLQTNVDVN